jgi:hypothetical protein
LTTLADRPIIAWHEDLALADPTDNRSLYRMTWIAFILAAIAGLLSIVYVRPVPAYHQAIPGISRST